MIRIIIEKRGSKKNGIINKRVEKREINLTEKFGNHMEQE